MRTCLSVPTENTGRYPTCTCVCRECVRIVYSVMVIILVSSTHFTQLYAQLFTSPHVFSCTTIDTAYIYTYLFYTVHFYTWGSSVHLHILPIQFVLLIYTFYTHLFAFHYSLICLSCASSYYFIVIIVCVCDAAAPL